MMTMIAAQNFHHLQKATPVVSLVRGCHASWQLVCGHLIPFGVACGVLVFLIWHLLWLHPARQEWSTKEYENVELDSVGCLSSLIPRVSRATDLGF